MYEGPSHIAMPTFAFILLICVQYYSTGEIFSQTNTIYVPPSVWDALYANIIFKK
jgi:hypothetical protein